MDRDPLKSIHILQALRWSVAAWQEDVSSTTIANCWLKSKVLGPKYGPVSESVAIQLGWKEQSDADDVKQREMIKQMDATIRTLQDKNHITEAMKIDHFLDLVDEVVEDNEEEIFEQILDSYSHPLIERDHETDEEQEMMAKVSSAEAITALNRLCLYEEQQDNGNSEVLRCLTRYRRDIRGRGTQELQQQSIQTYFHCYIDS